MPHNILVLLLRCAMASVMLAEVDSVRAQTSAVRTGALVAPEATQAVAAGERFVYAIGSAAIAKYERATGHRLAVSTAAPGAAPHHLNSGFVWQGQLYCAHSNYPKQPARSQIMALDTATMVLSVFKDFGEYRGSLTWVVREAGFWWCNFARYGTENAQTTLVKLDDQWHEHGAWTYPPQVIQELGKMSISGGLWQEGRLLVTGHDKRVLYRLKLPQQGAVLELTDTLPAPFPGQGIALDPKTGGLLGINRAKREVVFAELREAGPKPQ
jgi:hypothetical protein